MIVSELYWCLHCEFVSLYEYDNSLDGDYLEEKVLICPRCGAYGLGDLWEWSDKQEFVVKNGYPILPDLNKQYPMYPK